MMNAPYLTSSDLPPADATEQPRPGVAVVCPHLSRERSREPSGLRPALGNVGALVIP